MKDERGLIPSSLPEQAALVRERNRILMGSADAVILPLDEITDEYYKDKVVRELMDRGRPDNWYLDDDQVQQRFRDDYSDKHYVLSLDQILDPEDDVDEFEVWDEEDGEQPSWDLEEVEKDRFEVTEEFLASVKDSAGLSKTQAKVAEWIASGADLNSIEYANRLSDVLGCAPATARVHMMNTVKKLSACREEPEEYAYVRPESNREGQSDYEYPERGNGMLQGRNRVSPEDAYEGRKGEVLTGHLDSDWRETSSMVNGGPAPLDVDGGYDRQRREHFQEQGLPNPDSRLPGRTRAAWGVL